MNCYPKIPKDIKVKHYQFCKNIVVNKSKVNINNLKQIIEIYNTKLSVSNKVSLTHFGLLQKYDAYFAKHKKRRIQTLKDLNGLSSLPEYAEIYDAIEILISVLKKNMYDIPYISDLLFDDNQFVITELPNGFDKTNIKLLKFINYTIKNKILANTN